jgi:hypothetical protein
MLSLPQTTPQNYLTGTSALNIPTDDGDFADWHFDETFLRAGTRFRVAGLNYPSTDEWLGTMGVRECSDILRNRGVNLPFGQAVYAASYPRAVLDLVLNETKKHSAPSYVDAENLLSPSDLRIVFEHIERVRPSITDARQLSLIDQWTQEQVRK